MGHPVWVPLKKNQFFDDAPGELSNFAQVTISRDRALKVTLVKRSNRAAPVTTGKDIGLDWGLNSMFASDLGDQLGRQFYPWLRKVDAQLTKINVELQRRGIKPKTNARYRKFNQRIREYVRNEVGRILNRLVKRYGIKSKGYPSEPTQRRRDPSCSGSTLPMTQDAVVSRVRWISH
ncbi:MAG: hypothetical protein ACYCTG_02525 [Ferrimicrobium sp.]